jgi:hypothetical protein
MSLSLFLATPTTNTHTHLYIFTHNRYCGGPDNSPKTFAWNVDKPNFPIGEDPKSAKKHIHPNALGKLHFCGLFAMIDPERPQVPGAVEKCKAAGTFISHWLTHSLTHSINQSTNRYSSDYGYR